MTLAYVKALVYDQIGLRPEQQQIEYKGEDNTFVMFEEDDNLHKVKTIWSEEALYLKSVAYCPR